jgi:hypothetical protein
MIEIGFTGSQHGMTKIQESIFYYFLRHYTYEPIKAFHHGDCIGADKIFHNAVRQIVQDSWIKIHPPVNESRRAFCKGDEYAEPKEYLDRNTDIVRESDILLATPNTVEEQLRSGTWSTWRKGKKKFGMTTVLILPDGQYKLEKCNKSPQLTFFS